MRLQLAALLLALLTAAATGPALAQDIPYDIPDRPGESLEDRAREQLEERHRGFISRLFTAGQIGVAPVNARDGMAYDAGGEIGMTLRDQDAVLLSVGVRQFPPEATSGPAHVRTPKSVAYVALGYEMDGGRLLPPVAAARRSSMAFGAGLMYGDATVLTLDLTPRYELLGVDDFWSVPVGLKVSLVAVDQGSTDVQRLFVGVTAGVRVHFGRRERLAAR